MSRARGTSATKSPAGVRNDLLARLGLDGNADDQAVETKHGEIVDFLDSAPAGIRTWADRRQQEADRIFALLTAPARDEGPAAPAVAVRPAQPAPRAQAVAPPAAPSGARSLLSNKPFLIVAGLVVALAVVFGVYKMGASSSNLPAMTSAQTDTATGTATVNQAQLAALMAKLKTNPKDSASLQSVAEVYYAGGDYTNAKLFEQQVLDIKPNDATALLGLGASAYAAGDAATAEKSWLQAAKLYPNNPEAHYDLGFLYMTTNRTAQMRTEWAEVVRLAPGSDLAKTVQQQLPATSSTATATK